MVECAKTSEGFTSEDRERVDACPECDESSIINRYEELSGYFGDAPRHWELSEYSHCRLFMTGRHSRRKGIDLLRASMQEFSPDFEFTYTGGRAESVAPIANVVEPGNVSEAELTTLIGRDHEIRNA